MILKLERLPFDRAKYLQQGLLRELPIVWDSEKRIYCFEYIPAWLNGLLFHFKGFIHGYYEFYLPSFGEKIT